MSFDGSADIARAAQELAGRLPAALAPAARLAYNYRWAWLPGAADAFRSIDPHRWETALQNPVRLLQEAPRRELERAAEDAQRWQALAAELDADLGRPWLSDPIPPDHPVAFLCAEYGIHVSLPIYSGGLGVLAGDMLKEASDRAVPMVGVGLLYRQSYFRQTIDPSGWQHEHWIDLDPERLPEALVTAQNGEPLSVSVNIRSRDVAMQVWRVDVGRVPLYLLDSDVPENDPVDRWITARLYVADRETRLAQYAVLGIGGVLALHAMGFDPGVVHLNEGHAAFAPIELAHEAVLAGASLEDALAQARHRTVFTTHTPVAAGNEAYNVGELNWALGELPAQLGCEADALFRLGRVNPTDAGEGFGLTPLGIHMSRAANAVSRRHGEVAREMWQPMFPGTPVESVPIRHVTNGVHLPTWMAPAVRELLDRHVGEDWWRNTADPRVAAGIDTIPDSELWAVRNQQRARLVEYVADRSVHDRLARGERAEYVQAAALAFDPEVLTLGFARRLATYKRLYLIIRDAARALALIAAQRPVQIVLAGKAHPADVEGKRIVQQLFSLKDAPFVAGRVVFVEDYDLGVAQHLVSGCDVWVNLPRPPLEASGTSGMKAAMNGSLNLSVLDGWWAEAYDGENGWAIDSPMGVDAETQDSADAARLYEVLEKEVLPTFHDRDAAGVPPRWVAHVRASLKTAVTRFTSARMLEDYLASSYRVPPD
ncbi:MAG TPA: alpha-glucan family phosphorylase [Candidatus Dormibacteraeota bacterium]|nr:alpha-glucan family phosphorylase [Candidatus Dormibacteraeota bacterium]